MAIMPQSIFLIKGTKGEKPWQTNLAQANSRARSPSRRAVSTSKARVAGPNTDKAVSMNRTTPGGTGGEQEHGNDDRRKGPKYEEGRGEKQEKHGQGGR
jgi:hypothetical protein